MKISAPLEQFDYDVTCVIFVYLAWICQPFCIYGSIVFIKLEIFQSLFLQILFLILPFSSPLKNTLCSLILYCSSLRIWLFQSFFPVSFILDNFDCYVFKSTIFVSSADSNILLSIH